MVAGTGMVNGKMVRFEGEEFEDAYKAAQSQYESQSVDFKAGLVRTVDKPATGNSVTLLNLCFEFMQARQNDLNRGSIGLPMIQKSSNNSRRRSRI